MDCGISISTVVFYFYVRADKLLITLCANKSSILNCTIQYIVVSLQSNMKVLSELPSVSAGQHNVLVVFVKTGVNPSGSILRCSNAMIKVWLCLDTKTTQLSLRKYHYVNFIEIWDTSCFNFIKVKGPLLSWLQ